MAKKSANGVGGADIYERVRGYILWGFGPLGKSGEEFYGRCPFCEKPKFYVNPNTRLFSCQAGLCHRSGNFNSYLLQIYEKALLETSRKDYNRLSELRGISSIDLQNAGLAFNGARWMIPIRSIISLQEEPGENVWKGEDNLKTRFVDKLPAPKGLSDIRHWSEKKGAKCQSTPGAKLGIFSGEKLLLREYEDYEVWVCEAEFDAIAMDNIIRRAEQRAIAIGFPGAMVCKKEWLFLFDRRRVHFTFDADIAGVDGMNRIYKMITENHVDVRRDKYIHWPKDVAEGYDIRDLAIATKDKSQSKSKSRPWLAAYRRLLAMLETYPPATTKEKYKVAKARDPIMEAPREDLYKGVTGVSHSRVYKDVTKYMALRSDWALIALFGTVIANRISGEPIWLFIVGPPGCGKTELLMGLSVLPEIVAVSTLTPRALISGAPAHMGRDPSLIPKLNNRILVIKDFTSIMAMNAVAREEIYGVLRDAYDGKCEKVFGHGIQRKYESRFGIIAGVTPAIDGIGTVSTSLGERFLKFRIPAPKKLREEEMIRAALGNIGVEGTIRKEMERICLGAIAGRDSTLEPDFPGEELTQIVALAQLCARLRGSVDRERYTRELIVLPSREVGTRIAKQLGKLAIGMAIYLDQDSVMGLPLDICRKIAIDSIPEKRWKVFQTFLRAAFEPGSRVSGGSGLTVKEAVARSRIDAATMRGSIEDLQLLGLLRRQENSSGSGGEILGSKTSWALDPAVRKMVVTSGLMKMSHSISNGEKISVDGSADSNSELGEASNV